MVKTMECACASNVGGVVEGCGKGALLELVHGVRCGRAKVAPLPCARIDVGHLELSSSVMIKVVLCLPNRSVCQLDDAARL